MAEDLKKEIEELEKGFNRVPVKRSQANRNKEIYERIQLLKAELKGFQEGQLAEQQRIIELIKDLNLTFLKDNSVWKLTGDELNDLWEEKLLSKIQSPQNGEVVTHVVERRGEGAIPSSADKIKEVRE